ncbi:MAG TPA: recombinase family protein [Thermomicrobiales bacterium]|jgi:site-specific DNA recombinase
MRKIVAAYARVSTERQVESQTIAQQVAALRAYAAGQGWNLADEQIYCDDGWSGARLDRPALDRLRDAVGRALVDTLLIAGPDRLARRYAYQVWLLEEFARAGCAVVFLDRPPTDDPQDALLVQIRGAVAEYERTVIADRTRRGRLAALQAGRLLPWSSPPYGYRVAPQAPRDPAGVALDEERAAVVRQVFAWYVEDGLTLHAIAQRLTAAGTPTATGQARWGPTSVGGILRNTAYRGTAYGNRERRVPARRRYPLSGREPRRAGGVSAQPRPEETWIAVPVPAIVTADQFAAARERLARNRAWSPRNTQGEYLLRRLVSCRRCGRAECVSNNGRYAYYRCLPRPGEEHTPCQEQPVPTSALDAVAWADPCQVLTEPAILEEAVRRAQAGWLHDDARAARHHDLRQRHAALDRQRQRLIDAYAAETITLAELRTRVQALEARLAALAHEEQQLAASTAQQVQIALVASRAEAFRASIAQGLDQASFTRRRELIELLIERVLVDPPEVEIRYVIPFGGAAHRKVALQSRHPGATCLQVVADGGAGHSRRSGRTSGTSAGSSRR